MSTPTDEQQLRATLRRHGRHNGPDAAVAMVVKAIGELFPDSPWPIPPLMAPHEAAGVLKMHATNLKRLSPPLRAARDVNGRDIILSGGRVPVYRESDVMAAKARRDARRATA